ncbi:MAG: hypothetical protein M1840_003161 [Geoglossum simile]|nr:MAG: hypothetical protein M1840_003161 [Geoglossum simile]
MYVYSLFALALAGYLTLHLRKQSPVHVLGLAWFYVLDSVINAVYTTAFAFNWFLVISQHKHAASGIGKSAKTMGDAPGFTSPKHNVSSVDANGQEAVAVGYGVGPGFGLAILQPESMTSILIILTLWSLRVYFILVIMSYARGVLRQHVYSTSSTGLYRRTNSDNPDETDRGVINENPFATDKEEGRGWEGRVGRAMIALGRSYWLGIDEDDGWARGMGGKFRRSGELNVPMPVGPLERERRRRNGTGPPPPPAPKPATPGTPWSVQGIE